VRKMSDLEVWIPVIMLVVGAGAWGLNKYKSVMADGKVSLEEVLDTVSEATDKVEEIADAVEDAKDAE